eukprot:scaffold8028_cov444-Prasinococcus_capsulatus_cf.AAC.3
MKRKQQSDAFMRGAHRHPRAAEPVTQCLGGCGVAGEVRGGHVDYAHLRNASWPGQAWAKMLPCG